MAHHAPFCTVWDGSKGIFEVWPHNKCIGGLPLAVLQDALEHKCTPLQGEEAFLSWVNVLICDGPVCQVSYQDGGHNIVCRWSASERWVSNLVPVTGRHSCVEGWCYSAFKMRGLSGSLCRWRNLYQRS